MMFIFYLFVKMHLLLPCFCTMQFRSCSGAALMDVLGTRRCLNAQKSRVKSRFIDGLSQMGVRYLRRQLPLPDAVSAFPSCKFHSR